MKKQILFLCMMMATMATAFGQLKKGDLFVGAELSSLGFGVSDRPYYISAGLAPQAGLMLSSKVALGVRTKFTFSHWRSNATTGNILQYEAGLFGRYWFRDEGNVRPFVELAAGAGTDSGFGRNYAHWAFQEAYAGTTMMVSDKIGIDLGLGLRMQESLNSPGAPNILQLKVKAGINFYLDGKRKE